MPFFEYGQVTIHYEEFGAGYPVLLFSPGGMGSSVGVWWRQVIDAIKVLEDSFRVIVFDQRNAGQSRAPVSATDSWEDYARDAIELINHLDLQTLHVWGQCIGPSYAMKVLELLGSEAARITAFVDQMPSGLSATNRGHFMYGFYRWIAGLPPPTLPRAVLMNYGMDPGIASFCQNMFGGDFVFSVTRDFVRTVSVPMLILPGNDLAHPEAIALETAQLAQRAEVRLGWQNDLPAAADAVVSFLQRHTPSNAQTNV